MLGRVRRVCRNGHVFRSVNRGDKAQGEVLSEKGGLADAPSLRGSRRGSRDRASRLPAHRRAVVPGRGRELELDQCYWPRIGADDGAVPRHEAGSGSRSERRDQMRVAV